ncbi:hypothetical protein CAPTEDRAFT_111275 [Capitella teleta]|uniref:poly(A)-specific ribonuclease n=1 Tax=Capitella teleta TaxID=283909 RepID=R7TSI3_CAPTE|nr:hypothetical protein CAPTEDRAFT_111275 [Capitella teleta]|eukprot:ELT93990.1 hypothetical protein CAPTEDRAFT_111275 [Capitella teleta]
MAVSTTVPEYGIQNVWASNLESEFRKIRHIVQKYPYVAMDTEFPGLVARPTGNYRSNADYQYQLIRCNVDVLKPIQVGITFMDGEGKSPSPVSTWQFNCKFNPSEDIHTKNSVDLLSHSDIDKKQEAGIEVNDLAEMLMTSGIVLCDKVKWLTFHSGFDFGYLLKILTNANLPAEEDEFFELLKLYCPKIYDVKYLMDSCKDLKGDLHEVSEQLQLERRGHPAGSDSLLTGAAFFKMREMFFEDNIDDSKYCGRLYGLGSYGTIGDCAVHGPSSTPTREGDSPQPSAAALSPSSPTIEDESSVSWVELYIDIY